MKNKANYRILTQDYKVKYTGTDKGSWFFLEDALKLVDRSKGEMVYEYYQGQRLWEVF